MDYKSYVGNPKHYDLIGKIVFDLLLNCGLKPEHKLLDIGCGSLRAGRHLIDYLDNRCYFGIEPNEWLIKNVIKQGQDFLYDTNNNFDLQCFNSVIDKYDFILANSIFIHACKSQIEKCFSEVDKVLKPNGCFIFNYIEGKDNEKTEWSYPSAVTYTKEYIHSILDKYPLGYTYLNVKYPGKQKFILAVRS